MNLNNVLIVILFLLPLHAFGQTEVKIPQYSRVEATEYLEYSIPIYINKKGEINIEGEATSINSLKQKLTQSIIKIGKRKRVYSAIAFFDLVIDKELEFKYFEPVLETVREMGFLKVNFACNSPNAMRKEGETITGILYKLSPSERNDVSYYQIVRDSLDQYYSKNERLPSKKFSAPPGFPPPPPPPPPAPTFSKKDLLSDRWNYDVKGITILDDFKYKIDGKIYSKNQIIDKIYSINRNSPCAYIINASPSAKYESFLFLIVKLNFTMRQIWNEMSQAEFNLDKKSLDPYKAAQIELKNPMVILYNELK